MATLTIYHNPRCTKSREALALLQQRGLTPRIVEYLQTPPSAAELKGILRKLGMPAQQLVRKAEQTYKTKYAARALTEDQWIEAMAADPILIERPIVISGDRAVIGRPPENVLKLL